MKTRNQTKYRKYGFLALTVLTILFIFSNSLRSAAASSAQSGRVFALLQALFGGSLTEHLVRKIAHFGEFFALGVVLMLLFGTRKPANWIVTMLLTAMTTALLDETIQIFTGRGPQVQDVWLDIAGAVSGMVCSGGLLWLVRRVRKKR